MIATHEVISPITAHLYGTEDTVNLHIGSSLIHQSESRYYITSDKKRVEIAPEVAANSLQPVRRVQ